ncbi:MAG: phosphoribosylformylglycinamidine synthase I [Candidatus Heimdallarchaeota archaeon]|nr:phosphoribosylformylglycinamidine synthase I [Candidatus Heimdallarchaeota archaeon]
MSEEPTQGKRSLEDIEKDLKVIDPELKQIEDDFKQEIAELSNESDQFAEIVHNEEQALRNLPQDIKELDKPSENRFSLALDDVSDDVPSEPTEDDSIVEDSSETDKIVIRESENVDQSDKKKTKKVNKTTTKKQSFSKSIKIGVTRFPGTNNEYETIRALESFGVSTQIINEFDVDQVEELDGIWLAGGFSFSDVLRAGAIASVSDLMGEIIKQSKPILGVCNGFQILTEANLLPGALIPNTSTKFICDWVHISISENDSYLNELSGTTLRLPIAHFEGNLYADTVEAIKPYTVARYSNFKGLVREAFNPNGSIDNIAGLGKGSIVGMMPHPERASFRYQSSIDGRKIIRAFLGEVKR